MKFYALVFSTVFALSCGGDDDIGGGGGGDPVTEFVACGGDLQGTWDLTSSAFSGNPDFSIVTGCPGATGTFSSYMQTGTLDFAASMDFTFDTTLRVDLNFTIPGECAIEDGVNACSELDITEGGISMTCTGDIADTCNCTQNLEEIGTEVGTWTASGNSLTLDEGDAFGYCVENNQLQIRLDEEEIDLNVLLTATRQ